MNKASNAKAPAMSPSDEERSLSLALSLAPTEAAAPAPSGVTEHAPPTVLVTAGLASSAVGLAADPVSSVTSRAAEARTEPARDPVEPGDGEPPYSADEAAWLFGLERVAPVPSSQLAQKSEPSSSLGQAEPSSSLGPVEPSSSPPGGLSAQAASAQGAVSHAEPAPMSTPLPMPVPMAQDDPSQTSALSAEITAALLPAPDLSGLSAQAAPAPSEQLASEPSAVAPAVAADGEAALPLAARQTLHLQQLPTPLHAAPGDANTPPHGHAGFVGADLDAGAPTGPGAPRDSETTASLQLPATLPQQLRLPRAPEGVGPPTRPGEVSLVRRAAGSLLANLGMGLLGGLLALLGAVGFLYLRGDGATRSSSQQAATPQAASARPDQAARTRLLEQVTQSLLAGRRHQAVVSLREYAALSPEPAIEELIRILEREP